VPPPQWARQEPRGTGADVRRGAAGPRPQLQCKYISNVRTHPSKQAQRRSYIASRVCDNRRALARLATGSANAGPAQSQPSANAAELRLQTRVLAASPTLFDARHRYQQPSLILLQRGGASKVADHAHNRFDERRLHPAPERRR
jgi:hypothetical protein